MSAIVQLLPLSGGAGDEPLAFLLEVDETALLLDCGWDLRYQASFSSAAAAATAATAATAAPRESTAAGGGGPIPGGGKAEDASLAAANAAGLASAPVEEPSLQQQQQQLERDLDAGDEYLQRIKALVDSNRIDAVLLSHPDMAHLGLLPFLVGKLGLRVPIYATIPVFKMGQMFMYDAHQSAGPDFSLFNLDDVDAAFSEQFVQLRYAQRFSLALGGGKGVGIDITPHPAGHMIGGTVWRIRKETEEIVYAVDFNHKKERHLRGTTLHTLTRPTLLITDVYAASAHQRFLQSRRGADRSQRNVVRKTPDAEVVTQAIQTLRNGGNVLVPVDTSGRALELLLAFEHFWRTQQLSYTVAFLSHVSFNTLEFAKSQLEWMSDAVMQAFENTRENPFELRHVIPCHELEELDELPGPVCVLATDPQLDGTSFSKDLFLRFAGDPRSAIIFTQRALPGTLAHKVSQHLVEPPPEGAPAREPVRKVEVSLKERIDLEGEELEEHLREQERRAEQRARELAAKQGGFDIDMLKKRQQSSSVMEMALGDAEAAASSEEEEEDTDDFSDDEVAAYARLPFAEGRHDADAASFRDAGLRHPVFPFVEKTRPCDEYGETVFLADFAQAAQHETGRDMDQTMDERRERRDRRSDDEASSDDEGMEDDNPLAAGRKEEEDAAVKYIDAVQVVDIQCSLSYIDCDGRVDLRSLKTILDNLQPRRLIFVRGTPDGYETMRSHVQSSLIDPGICQNLTVPSNGQTVNVTSDSRVYKVKLKDSLLSSVKLKTLGDYQFGFVQGRISMADWHLQQQREAADQSGAAFGLESATGTKAVAPTPHSRAGMTDAGVPILEELPTGAERARQQLLLGFEEHKPIMVGDVRLSDFKRVLQTAGLEAEFAEGGVLVTGNGKIALRRIGQLGAAADGRSRIQLEGVLSPEYFRVRELLYGQVAFV